MRSRTGVVPTHDTVVDGAGLANDALVLKVRVIPRASSNEIVGFDGETLKVRLTAPPVEGKANRALVKLLAKTLGVRKSGVEIVSGHSGRLKMVRLEGTDRDAALRQICQLREKK
jgi:hypothetical protein